MKTKNRIILAVLVSAACLVVIPSGISIVSPIYCNSIYPVECVTYSVSLIPNFGPVVDGILDKEEAQRQYDTTPATCNDALTGKPDGKCFLDSFESCRHASIKNSVNTFEGDPVFLYAYVDIDDCKIRHMIDLRLDEFSSIPDRTFHSSLCTNVKSDDHTLYFECDDGEQMLSLR